jgi:hypothetical protein
MADEPIVDSAASSQADAAIGKAEPVESVESLKKQLAELQGKLDAAAAPISHEQLIQAFRDQQTRDIEDRNQRAIAAAQAQADIDKAVLDAELRARAEQQAIEEEVRQRSHELATVTPQGIRYLSGCI